MRTLNFDLPKKMFITGTDTGIGKTVVSAMLTLGLKAEYWKPVQSGLTERTDTDTVKYLTGLPDSHFHKETYRLNEPLSPHASAAIDGVEISINNFKLPDIKPENHLIIEGAGGLMVPLNDEAMIIDLIKQLDIPVLLVSRSSLGTLNHTFLSLDQLRRYDIDVLGVIMSGPLNLSNRKAIEKYGEVPVLGELPQLDLLQPELLKQEFDRIFG